MTEDEVAAFNGKPVRVTLADGRVLAGTLHSDGGGDHGHAHYTIVSDPVREGGQPVRETIHGADQIAQVEDASNDPAAVE